MNIKNLLIAAVASLGLVSTAHAAGGAAHSHPPEEGWTFDGFFGTFDQAQLQRGYKVYREVCAACHGMELPQLPQSRYEGRSRSMTLITLTRTTTQS